MQSSNSGDFNLLLFKRDASPEAPLRQSLFLQEIRQVQWRSCSSRPSAGKYFVFQFDDVTVQVTGCLIAHGITGNAEESAISSLLSSLREMDESVFTSDGERLHNFLSNHLEKMVRLETVKTLEKIFKKGKPHGTVDHQKLAEEVFAWIKDEYIGVYGKGAWLNVC